MFYGYNSRKENHSTAAKKNVGYILEDGNISDILYHTDEIFILSAVINLLTSC